MQFVRMTRQSAYVFSKWLKCPVVGEYVKEVQIFADNAREARSMAKNLFNEIQERNLDTQEMPETKGMKLWEKAK